MLLLAVASRLTDAGFKTARSLPYSDLHDCRRLLTTANVLTAHSARWRHGRYQEHGNNSDDNSTHSRWNRSRMRRVCMAAALVTGGGAAGLYLAKLNKNNSILLAASKTVATAQTSDVSTGDVKDVQAPIAGVYRHDLPTFTMQDVALHDCVEQGVWMTYGRGVYDVTQFINRHPGGSRALLMAAGGSTEPFWQLFAVHKEPHVLAVLEQYRIGNLCEVDAVSATETASSGGSDGVWSHEPLRHPALRVNSQTPFNAETPLDLLGHSFYTPNELFYVRNHLPVPHVNAADYNLEVDCWGEVHGDGEDSPVLSLSLDDLRTQFEWAEVDAVIMCAGNRRSEMAEAGVRMQPTPRHVRGLSWAAGAVGNARWRGVRLADVLRRAGCDTVERARALGVRHVCFEALDSDAGGEPYGASIPIEHALDPRADVLLALEMNGNALSRDHGYPVRVVVPGVAGARCVKWVSRVFLSTEESKSHWQRRDYKGFCPSTDWDSADYASQASIQQMPVTSAFCRPQLPPLTPGGDGVAETAEVLVSGDRIKCSGYAWSGGGRRVVRVDVSSDGGATWRPADKLQQYDNTRTGGGSGDEEEQCQEVGRCWSWTLWSAEVPVKPGTAVTQLCVKAVDDSHNSQPETFESIWNFRGVLSNAFHRLNVQLKWRN